MKTKISTFLLFLAFIGNTSVAMAGNPYSLANPYGLKQADGKKNVAEISLLRVINPLHRDIDFVDPAERDASSSVEFKFTEFGGGIQLGYQWVIGQGITIDWYFLGPRVSKFNMSLLFQGDLGDPTYYTDSEEDMKNSFRDIPVVGRNVTTTATSNSLEVKAPFWFPNIRSGIAIGVAF